MIYVIKAFFPVEIKTGLQTNETLSKNKLTAIAL